MCKSELAIQMNFINLLLSSQLEIIDQNMLAQSNILTALSEANANFASTRKVAKNTAAARNKAIQDLLSAYDSFSSILSKADDASKFYELLLSKVSFINTSFIIFYSCQLS